MTRPRRLRLERSRPEPRTWREFQRELAGRSRNGKQIIEAIGDVVRQVRRYTP